MSSTLSRDGSLVKVVVVLRGGLAKEMWCSDYPLPLVNYIQYKVMVCVCHRFTLKWVTKTRHTLPTHTSMS